MSTLAASERRATVLVVIPAYNEAQNIEHVIRDLLEAAPGYDRLFVNDGALDETGRILQRHGERQLRLPCNLGYGRAVQLGLRYGLERGYDVIVTFDADGQHRARDVPVLVRSLLEGGADVVIGSRYAAASQYTGPLGRRIGQQLFSRLTAVLTGRRTYDTTSGLKAMRPAACRAALNAVSHDFHAETIVRLSLAGFRIAEEPILMRERVHGRSMHSLRSAISYPLQTLLLTVVALVDALLIRRVQ